MRAAHLSLCVLLTALFLSASIVTPYGMERPRIPTLNEIVHLASHRAVLANEPTLSFPHPFQAVNNGESSAEPVQVGAWGDSASVGNSGVQIEIQTNAYNVSSEDDAFWVGDVLSDGSFVQFGYLLMPPGYYCLYAQVTAAGTTCLGGSDNVGLSDARWFWSYFPNSQAVNDWYYGFGAANSAGSNGTWHLYSILPSASRDWVFMMDGATIYSSNFPSTTSSSPAHLVAEKASGPYLSQLGPVEFRGLAYLGNDSMWHATSSLSLIDGCGAADNGQCVISNAYGVESVGPNDVIAGSSTPSDSEPGQLVWQRQSTCTLGSTLSSSSSAGNAPFNVTFVDSVSSPQGMFRTDWWFGDGSHEAGELNQTVTYSMPGNYTPFVRVLDSVGCLSEASGQVYVGAANSSILGSVTVSTASCNSVATMSCFVPLRDAYVPSE